MRKGFARLPPQHKKGRITVHTLLNFVRRLKACHRLTYPVTEHITRLMSTSLIQKKKV